ncbi:amidohydrolase family protein [Variovorax fucosicus]|uniref:amidohydrolase family protein n=1 Tax=Variovorax fucosicus TaxID=3053517 RepID=UPI002577FC5F|nr:amidohydrolase family protein [Variovorax sp. J22G47]MDM0055868.1 amidohydrolase family protein [Variovorax sp. J22G47]
MKKIDSYAHIFPRAYFDRMASMAKDKGAIKRWLTIPVLYDLEARLKMMEGFPDYQQVLTLSNPPIELIAGPDDSPELARLANDGMAAIRDAHPEKFPAFVASLPMNNVPEALKEMERAITVLGARGIQVFTNVNGRPLDEEEFWPIFEAAVNRYDVPIWMHPARGANVPDYASESKSRYEIWWTFGWPYETSAAMARMVFSGFFDRLPNMKLITHHMGAMIPFFDGRVGPGLDQFGSRTSDEDYEGMLKRMAKRPIDYFRMFYADTALAGGRSGLRCGLDFFGARQVLFATDCPFDPEGGPMFLRTIPKAIDELGLSESEQEGIYFRNALRLLKLPCDC